MLWIYIMPNKRSGGRADPLKFKYWFPEACNLKCFLKNSRKTVISYLIFFFRRNLYLKFH